MTNVSQHGFWILVAGEERFVAVEHFPWFLDAPIDAILDVELQGPGHLYWPTLDVDLAIDSIDHPERFPLMSRRKPVPASPASKRRDPRTAPGRRS